jgi:hypothetical protein
MLMVMCGEEAMSRAHVFQCFKWVSEGRDKVDFDSQPGCRTGWKHWKVEISGVV